jgi:hypothetical protein
MIASSIPHKLQAEAVLSPGPSGRSDRGVAKSYLKIAAQ